MQIKKIIGNKIAVEMLQEKLSDTIAIPNNLIERAGNARAKVTVVGTGVKEPIKVGDTVLVAAHLGARLPDNKTRVYLIDDVVAIL
jgi:co-chaperonin GroES (HSP10)